MNKRERFSLSMQLISIALLLLFIFVGSFEWYVLSYIIGFIAVIWLFLTEYFLHTFKSINKDIMNERSTKYDGFKATIYTVFYN